MNYSKKICNVDLRIFNQAKNNLRLESFRTVIQENIHKIQITMNEGLSPYIYVDWLKKEEGGVIWGHRFMIEVPFPYEKVVTDPEFELQSVNVMSECVKDRYPTYGDK